MSVLVTIFARYLLYSSLFAILSSAIKVNKTFFPTTLSNRKLFPPKVGFKFSYFTMPDENCELHSTNICKRCNNSVVTGLKCRTCGVVSHKSCLKTIKAKFYNDSTVDCCVNIPVSVKTLNPATNLSTNIAMDVDKTVEQIKIAYLEEIIRQKDLIINNQAMLIDSLQAQIKFLNRDISNKSANVPLTPKHVSYSEVTSNKKTKSHNSKENDESQNTSQVTPSAVSRAIHNAHASKVCHELVNLASDVPARTKNQRNARKLLVGNANHDRENLNFKSARIIKMNYFHVTNCDPETTSEDLTSYLKTIVSSIQVDRLQSRNPSQYSSFKISVPSEDVPKILKSELWPSGVIVNKFFRAKSQNKPDSGDT